MTLYTNSNKEDGAQKTAKLLQYEYPIKAEAYALKQVNRLLSQGM